MSDFAKGINVPANDCISRQAAIDALTRKMVSIPTAGEKDLMGDVNRIRTEDISVIRRLPSAQPEVLACGEGELSTQSQRKKGKWIKGKMWSEGIGMGETYGFYYSCSECNNSVQGGYDECGKNFCEKCGADNRGDGETDE